jgi:P-type Cu+ transporter
MSPLSTVFSNLLSKSPLGGSVELPQAEDEPLTKALSDTCELRIEGMTCSACVEVRLRHRPLLSDSLLRLVTVN